MHFKFVFHCVYSLYMVPCYMKTFSYMYVSYVAHTAPSPLPCLFSFCPALLVLFFSLREFYVMYMHITLYICIKSRNHKWKKHILTSLRLA